jgi:hypothetical protein
MLTVAGLGKFVMLAVCVLGIGFMFRFLIAIASDENKVRVAHPVRAKKAGSEPALNPARHLAMGVVRITAALASNSRERAHAAVEQSDLITFSAGSREHESATARRYRWS